MRLQITLLLLLLAFCSFGQNEEVIPIDTKYDIFNLKGKYIKDVDGDFNFYIGTWISQDKLYKYCITIFSHIKSLDKYPNGDYNYEDKILATYKVTNKVTDKIVFDSENNIGYNKQYYGVSFRAIKKRIKFFFYDSNDGSNLIELHRKSNKLSFNVANKQIVVCGDPNFNYKDCILPEDKSIFEKVK